MLLELLLRSRRSTFLTLWELVVGAWSPLSPGCFRLAGAAFGASGAVFAWQEQRFDSLRNVGGGLAAAGP